MSANASASTSAASASSAAPAAASRFGAGAVGRISGAAPSDKAARLAAFCSPTAPAVFESVVYTPQLWTPDPFDVFEIHNEAREAFTCLLDRASATPPPQSGKLLLLKGEAGSGKTHLMRAFRKLTHEPRRGYFGYLQMSVKYNNYGRYLLGRLIDSLSQPYFPPEATDSGLTRLSTWVFDAITGVSDEQKQEFRDGGGDDVCHLVFEYADRALSDARLQDCDVDLMRALLFLQRGVPSLKEKATRWLRCQDLSPYDCKALGGMVPKTNDEDAIRMVAQLGKLMALIEGAALVICVDQLDDMVRGDANLKQFAEAVDTLVSLADEVPTAVLVIACIEDYYTSGRLAVARSKLDRLERDPEPIRLTNSRDPDEVESLLARRLDALYENAGLTADPLDPTFPFQPDQLTPLTGLSTRNVLDSLRLHHQKCIVAGTWLEPTWGIIVIDGGGPAPRKFEFEKAWNDFQAQFDQSYPEDEAGRARLLASAIQHCNAELPAGYEFSVAADGRMFPAARHTPESVIERFFIAVCEKSSRGGGLGRQVSEAKTKAGGTPMVIVRSTPFPKTPSSDIVKQLGEIIAKGGRRVEVEDADWRLMQAFAAFAPAHSKKPGFTDWVRDSRPMSQLPSLRSVLNLDTLPTPRALPAAASSEVAVMEDLSSAVAAVAEKATTAPTAAAKAAKPPGPTGPLRLGVIRGITAEPATLEMSELRQHMAFLGGSGSGKTTAALLILEQLLQRGVPVILIDRKGDLCRYADPDAWTSPDPAVNDRLAALRQQVEVALYTPGASAGRGLRIPVAPEGLAQMPTAEREQFAEFSAAALAAMMGYNPRKAADKIHQVIIAKAIGILAEVAGASGGVTLERIHGLIESQDSSLLNAANGYDTKHYRKLAENLLTLRHSSTRLLGAESDERLDINALLGRSSASGKTRLCIISTQALGDPAAVDFWVSQLLVALDRWRAKSPSEILQAALMLDEADQYLPATRQPATKAPLESLLRRARSAGLGIFLATQSPGDLDYRCRDQIRNWLVGRVRETVALNKLKPMFADAKLDVAAKLPNQSAGEFILLREGQAVAVKTDRSLMDTRQVEEGLILQLAAKTR